VITKEPHTIISRPFRTTLRNLMFFILLLVNYSMFSQDKNEEDIKVGLVLSGGGAKGFAHIGALKVIEEAGVRIDYIGGTSTGAIVGALYASGYSATQIDSIFKATDFVKLIQDDLPRSAKTFFEKEEAEKYALTLPFDDFKVALPSSISKGQNVYNLFSKLTSHVDDIDDFNELPIPFFCVATNIETGKETILNKGYLPRAVTASAALPTLFTPVKLGDSLYVDGGVTNNYPVEAVRAMGADIIIGIDVQDALKTRESLKTAIAIMNQVGNYKTIEDMVKKRRETDIYIHPDITNYSVISFDDKLKIIENGIKETKLYYEELKELASRQKSSKRKEFDFSKNDSLFITSIKISGNKQYTRSYILGKLKLRTPTKTSFEKFNEGVNNLSSTNNFNEINYRFYNDGHGGTKVVFDIMESESKTSLRLGVHFDDLYKTAILVNITSKRVITNNDILSFDFIIGDNLRYNFNYFIDKGYYWSLGLNSNFTTFDENVAISFVTKNDTEPIEETGLNSLNFEYNEFTNQVYVQTFFKRIFLLGVGAEHKWKHYKTETIGIDEDEIPQTVFEDTNYYSAFGYIVFDTFDNKFFPTKGLYFRGDYNLYLFANGINKDFNEFSVGRAKLSYAHKLFKDLSGLIEAEGGVKIGGDNTQSFDFFAGGYGFKESSNLVSLYGYDDLSFRGNTFLKATLTLDYKVFKNSHINIAANIANIGDDLFDNKGWIDGIDYTGYAIGCGWETIIGPIEAKYSYSPERGEGSWYFSVGYPF